MDHRYTCVLLSTDESHLADPVEQFVRAHFDVRHVSRHPRSEKVFPAAVRQLVDTDDIDLFLNFLAPMIVPARVLERIRGEAINFHPAPPAWPGIGSASYALYRGDDTFGATAHRMTTTVDGGTIIRVTRFPITPDETCDALSREGRRSCLSLLYEVGDEFVRHGRVSPSGDVWERAAMTRAEFERWMIIMPGDPPEDIARKVRALRHPRFPGPFMLVNGVPVALDGELGRGIHD